MCYAQLLHFHVTIISYCYCSLYQFWVVGKNSQITKSTLLIERGHLYVWLSYNSNYPSNSVEFILSTLFVGERIALWLPASWWLYFIHFFCGRKNRIVSASKLVIVFYPLFLWAKESRSDCQQAGNCILSTLFVGERIACVHYSIILFFVYVLNLFVKRYLISKYFLS